MILIVIPHFQAGPSQLAPTSRRKRQTSTTRSISFCTATPGLRRARTFCRVTSSCPTFKLKPHGRTSRTRPFPPRRRPSVTTLVDCRWHLARERGSTPKPVTWRRKLIFSTCSRSWSSSEYVFRVDSDSCDK